MDTRLCVGNLGDQVTSADLQQLFSSYGQVKHSEVMFDGQTGRSRGFGFVQLSNESQAQAALAALNGTTFCGRAISVHEPHLGPRPGEFGDRSGKEPCG